MLLYDVTYPNSRDMDKGVSWDYCRELAMDKKYEGAIAVCVNGEKYSYTLRNGRWIDTNGEN